MQESFLNTALGGAVTFRRFIIPYTDLTTAATSMNVALCTLSKGSVILGVRIKHSTAFAGAGPWTTCVVSVGTTIGSAYAAFASAFDVFQAVADTTLQETAQFKSTSYTAIPLVARFTASHNCSVATAGQVEIDILYLNMTTPL